MSPETYMNSVDEDAIVKIWIAAKVAAIGQVFFDAINFPIDKPDIEIEVRLGRRCYNLNLITTG